MQASHVCRRQYLTAVPWPEHHILLLRFVMSGSKHKVHVHTYIIDELSTYVNYKQLRFVIVVIGKNGSKH